MNENDKLRVKEAFLKAVLESPHVDRAIEGMATPTGEPVTLRMLVESTLKNDELYSAIDKLVASGEYTLDQIIENNVRSIKGNSPSPA